MVTTPKFKKLLQEGKKRHARFKKMGYEFRGIPGLKNTVPGNQHKSIIDALVATCTSKDEVEEVLTMSGFENYEVDIMEGPIDEFKQTAISICIAMMGTLTKEGMPCILKLKKE